LTLYYNIALAGIEGPGLKQRIPSARPRESGDPDRQDELDARWSLAPTTIGAGHEQRMGQSNWKPLGPLSARQSPPGNRSRSRVANSRTGARGGGGPPGRGECRGPVWGGGAGRARGGPSPAAAPWGSRRRALAPRRMMPPPRPRPSGPPVAASGATCSTTVP